MNLSLILKGFIVGVGKIIPGVSGAMLAVTLGIYEPLLEAITCFFNAPKKHFKLLLNIGVGVIFAILVFSRILSFLLNTYYYSTMYLLIGLIIGTTVPFCKELKFSFKNALLFLIVLGIMFYVSLGNSFEEFVFVPTISNYLYTLFLGVIDATSSVVPGISGTAIFMFLGVYSYVLDLLGNPFCLSFIIYGIGLVLGIIVVSYLMYFLLKYKKSETYMVIFSFMVGSIFLLMLNISDGSSLYTIILLLLGAIIGKRIG